MSIVDGFYKWIIMQTLLKFLDNIDIVHLIDHIIYTL